MSEEDEFFVRGRNHGLDIAVEHIRAFREGFMETDASDYHKEVVQALLCALIRALEDERGS